MKHKVELLTILLPGIMMCMIMSAQGTIQDYRRAYSLADKLSSSNVYYSEVTPNWIAGTDSFWYRRHTPVGDEYVLVNACDGSRDNSFTPDTQRRSGAGMWQGMGRTPRRRVWSERDDEQFNMAIQSPDRTHSAFIRDYNIWIRDTDTGAERQLSTDGIVDNYYSAYIIWSSDSKKLASMKIKPSDKHYIHYVESSPSDRLQPKLHTQEYDKPGDDLPFKVPVIYYVDGSRTIVPSTNLFDSQYEMLYLEWNSDSEALTFEYNQRGHQVYRVLELSAETGLVRPLIEETSSTFVNYNRRYRYDTEDGRSIIWMSERDNYNHLYCYDRAAGKVLHQITKGEWYVRAVQRVDEKNRVIYFSASGVNRDEDPYFIHYYRIDLDGKNMIELTPEPAMHEAHFSPDFRYIVDTYSTVTQPPVTVLRDAGNGHLISTLEKADISRLEDNGWRAPEVFVAKGRDGQTDMWGLIIRPTNFDPSRKYPVIEYIYAGPGDQYVPKSFFSYDWNMTALAELGFVVVQLDAMGTSYRSKSFEDVCWKNLKDAGFPDRIAWIKAAADKYPYLDISNVGIFGASAGGQESLAALLFHNDFYKVAYSCCGCHDNRMDKIWWNEQWMGYPIGDQYKESSNVDNAYRLKGRLMLVVGELDENVDPSSTMQVVNALIKANKDFELVVLPGVGHTMGEKYGEHKRYDFFVRNILGVEPPAWGQLE